MIVAIPIQGAAYDRELQLSGDLFYSRFFDGTANVDGGGVGARLRWACNDAIAITGGLDWAIHSVKQLEDPNAASQRHSGTAVVGVQWAVDSFDFVPFLGASLGGSLFLQDDLIVPSFVVSLEGGLDWRALPALSVGVFVDYQFFFGVVEVSNRLIAGARVGWLWSPRPRRSADDPNDNEPWP